MTKVRKAVIPAAGYGTRFLPITKVIPKELLPIGSKPAIQYVVEEAAAAGIEEVILVCHPSKPDIVNYFKPNPEFIDFLRKRGKLHEIEELSGIESLAKFTVVYQEERLGLGHAVWCARKAVQEEPFLVMLPDVLVIAPGSGTQELINICLKEGGWGVLLKKVSERQVSNYGIIEGEQVGQGRYRLRGAVEKPRFDEAPSDLSMLGRYLFTPEIFSLIEGAKFGNAGEIQLTDAIDTLARKMPGYGVLCKGRIFDVGMPEGFSKAFDYFEKQ